MIFTPKQYLWHGFGTLVLSLIASIFFNAICSSDFISPITKALDSFNLYDLCNHYINHNSDNKAEQELEINDDILLFSIAGCNSREEIAGKLQQITNLKPRVIGMDVIFGENSTTGKAVDDSLLRVVSRCPQLVTAKRITQHGDEVAVEHSFYTKLGNVDEACINIEDGIVRNFLRKLEVNDIQAQSFVDRIIERAYPEVYAELEKRGQNEERINYKPIEFLQLGMQDELFPEDVENKVVLIGDFEDLRDFHNIPTSIGGTSRIAGTKIHAYAITTLTKGRTIEQMGTIGGYILGFIVSYIFSIIACVCFVECDKLAGFLTNLVMIFTIFIISSVYGIIMIEYKYEPNITTALLGVGLAGFTSEIWFWLCTTRPYQWIQRKFHLPDGGVRIYVDSNGQRNA
ncbi:MAG: CHASE2 domain-containing protein [Paludibacteraceae bacterium]|nr:CHASE2 domain-containing protein [Paludibacteraceae bacterium]